VGTHRAGRERVVTKSVALAVAAKVRAAKGTIMGEARRLGVYHATLRKAVRDAIGSAEYDKLVLRGRTTWIGRATTKRREPKAPRLTQAPARCNPNRAAPTFAHVEGEFRCGQCGDPQPKAGTDGNGQGILYCSCGWTQPIPRLRVLP
jgi:hypothetical protein